MPEYGSWFFRFLVTLTKKRKMKWTQQLWYAKGLFWLMSTTTCVKFCLEKQMNLNKWNQKKQAVRMRFYYLYLVGISIKPFLCSRYYNRFDYLTCIWASSMKHGSLASKGPGVPFKHHWRLYCKSLIDIEILPYVRGPQRVSDTVYTMHGNTACFPNPIFFFVNF